MGLHERIDSLPPEMQIEVADFVEYLHQKQTRTQVPKAASTSLTAIRQLKGLGKEIWQDTDSDLFIEALRKDWE